MWAKILSYSPFKPPKFAHLLPNGDVISKPHWSILYMSCASELKAQI